MKLKYDIFLSDFDGTLVRSDGKISQENIRAIAAYRSAGGIFAVCTGRGLPSILPRVRELGMREGLVVAVQGSVVADIATGQLLKQGAFPVGDAAEVLRGLEARDLHIHCYTVFDFYANRRDEALGLYEKVCGVKAQIVPSLSELVTARALAVTKLLIMVEPKDQASLFSALTEEFGKKYVVTCSADCLIEILPMGHTKAQAVTFLSRYYGVDTARIAAIGDQMNDLPLLEAAGGRFTVENGVKQLKAIATQVPSNDENGVAFAILQYAMEGKV